MKENSRTIYFDESGYTGYDLLNPDQPIFCVASLDLSDDEAHAILAESFPRYQGNEFKFSTIWSRQNHRHRLVKFSEHIGQIADRAFIYNCDKKFTALTKAVDRLYEPLVHGAGHDFYANGFSIRYVNMFHYGLLEFGGPALYDAVLSSYDKFSRAPCLDTLSELQWRLRLFAESGPSELEPFLDALAIGAEAYLEYNDFGSQRRSNDIQVTCVLSSIFWWRTYIEEDIKIVHDDSSNFFSEIENWNAITAPDVMPATITTGEDREAIFPLRVIDTRPGDSKNSYTLQLCDMIAGLAARMLHSQQAHIDPQQREEIIRAGLGDLHSGGIRPGPDFIDGLPVERGGNPDTIDQLILAVGHREA